MKLFLERALFVVAPPDSGKSTQLRSMFADQRLGTKGVIPERGRIRESFYLSNERRLHIRLTSPHEKGENRQKFISKAKLKMRSGRWCFACPLQPTKTGNMPDVVKSVHAFIDAFRPERVRVVFLSPNLRGNELKDVRDFLAKILKIPTAKTNVEACCIDARKKSLNGTLLADFFDFT